MMIQCPYCGNIEENRGICSACGKIIIKEFEQKNERSGKYSCPLCDNGMLVLRHNSKTGFPFYGCSNYPRCGYTESIDNKQPIKSYKNRNSEKITGESILTYTEAWNKIVSYYEKYTTALETTIQTVWEDSVFSAILNYDTAEIDSQRAVQMGSTKKADIVVRKDGKDVIVAELKRHTEIVSDDGQEQLFSYLDRLKSVNIGILVCNKLYIYDYDFTKRDEENKDNRLEIPFERDNPCGSKFVELFSKENFNAQSIKEFIRNKQKEKQDVSAIRGEITAELIKELLKKHFIQIYAESTFEQAFSNINITVGTKLSLHKECPVIAKKTVVAGDLEKHEIIDICRKNGILIESPFTKAKLNAGAPKYWANPNKKFLKRTWWLVLVNTDDRKLHVFKIPENSIQPEQMKYKNRDLIDLQIYSDKDGFLDSRSEIYFLKWLVKTIAY